MTKSSPSPDWADDELDEQEELNTKGRNVFQHLKELKQLARAAYRRNNKKKQNQATTRFYFQWNDDDDDGPTFRLNQDGILEPSRAHPWPYLGYVLNTYKNLFLTFYFNWTMIFTAPLSSLAFVIAYPAAVVLLLIFEILLKVFLEYLGGEELFHYLSNNYGQGLGAINWGAPELLLSDQTIELVRATIPSLAKPAPPEQIASERRRTFDLSIAQTLVVLAALIYERDASKVRDAFQLSAKDGGQGKEPEKLEQQMHHLVFESERRIRTVAARWGLHFSGVSELKSLGGPFCGIFWSEAHPVIIVAFKGTTPTNYEEFLVDAAFQRADARSYLFGSVHQGFYESVFPTSGFGKSDTRDPYGAILEAVNEKAAHLKTCLGTDEAIQVWITGHSLGAAMSSLLFARWLKCPEELTDCVLRDCYVIGTPAVGDNDFASMFASHTLSPVTRSSTLWRVINKADLFCRLPPGYDSRTIGHYMSRTDFFNYSHVGHAIQIAYPWQSKPLRMYPSSYQPTMQVDIVLGAWRDVALPSNVRPLRPSFNDTKKQTKLPWWARYVEKAAAKLGNGNPIHGIEKLYPFLIRDHIPVHYFEGLHKARIHYEKLVDDEARSINNNK
ncbi:hypothetical protein EC973_002960 [Apophysomyces ossiformis]|uniref:Fungal lipase-type domain-containing protein n=1 Tax=Apophysomyces ossiformis TaxID=679940 RepID=A0A8H7EM96_9FUNG|nr:hypothetical protein EC973_002960 [Apophysomyces ossiformis]